MYFDSLGWKLKEMRSHIWDLPLQTLYYNGLEWHRYTKLSISNIYVLYTNCFVKIGEYHHVNMG